MCGRFAITLPPDAMAQLFDAVPSNDLPPVPNYNVCPTNRVHAVCRAAGSRRLVAMRWGFIPHWYKTPSDGPLLINARADTIAEKPAFRAAVRERRCLIPADGFYEWTKDEAGNRLPWFFRRADGRPSSSPVSGRTGSGGRTPDHLRHRHDRCRGQPDPHPPPDPVILRPEDWALWLGEEGKGAALLMKSPAEGELQFFRVDPKRQFEPGERARS
jgi:putative SOS response-associated peptidase YedK